ncbi:MAG: TrkH family potassium uptake protein [Bacillaceae bacterium]|nr:TrkH family potassium uptake protein [Bacillaceae bacterium]
MEQKRRRWSPVRAIVTFYAVAVLVATILLLLPISVKPGQELSLLDALFTAVSAISVTGLTVVNTADTFTPIGVFFLMVILQFGGIGIMTLSTFIWIIMGQNIGLSQRRLIAIDQNRYEFSGLVKLMQLVLGMAFLFEGIGTILFGTYFLYIGYADTWYEAFYYGMFHALSSYTNAGFDIFGNSLADFSHDYYVQGITMVLVILGAIGFPVLIEVREYFIRKGKNFRFSLFTKVTTFTYFFLLIAGAILIYLLENQHYMAGMNWHEKVFYSLFNSVTARSAGLSTMDVAEFGVPTQFILSILMFIGASPSSVGGGIRTTTFAVVILTLYTYAKGNQEVRVFRRRLNQEDTLKSFVVFSTAIILVLVAVIVIDAFEMQRFTLIEVLFEASSAFGTTGLSMGITGDLSPGSKLVITILMFIGRIGILSLLTLVRTETRTTRVRYPEERIIIG